MIQQKLRAEAIEYLGDEPHDVIPTVEQSKAMPYLNMVIREVRYFVHELNGAKELTNSFYRPFVLLVLLFGLLPVPLLKTPNWEILFFQRVPMSSLTSSLFNTTQNYGLNRTSLILNVLHQRTSPQRLPVLGCLSVVASISAQA